MQRLLIFIFATMRIVFILLFSLCTFFIAAQSDEAAVEGAIVNEETIPDSVLAAQHSPKKAALFSLIPGGGQIYNKKYWKVPLIYAAGGAAVYFSANNYKNYQLFRQTLISRVDTNSSAIDNHPNLTKDGVQDEMEGHQKNFELLIIAAVAVYAIQIVDATVDAHLMYFDVSDDLSLQIRPEILNLNNLAYNPSQFKPTLGLSIKLHIR
jgi:hypothetical protein